MEDGVGTWRDGHGGKLLWIPWVVVSATVFGRRGFLLPPTFSGAQKLMSGTVRDLYPFQGTKSAPRGHFLKWIRIHLGGQNSQTLSWQRLASSPECFPGAESGGKMSAFVVPETARYLRFQRSGEIRREWGRQNPAQGEVRTGKKLLSICWEEVRTGKKLLSICRGQVRTGKKLLSICRGQVRTGKKLLSICRGEVLPEEKLLSISGGEVLPGGNF